MSKKIKIGIIGGASIAERFFIPAVLEMPGHFELAGVASRSTHKAKYFADKFNTSSYIGYNTLLTKENLQAVYIPLPNSCHYEWVKKSLQHGLHVLVEKSLACEYDEVVELNQLAAEKKLVLIENFQFRFHSQLTFIQQLIIEKQIGEIRNIRSCFGFPPFSDTENIRYKRSLGGGALLDAGAYPLKITQILLGQDIYVDSSSLYYDPDYEVDTWGSAFIKSKTSKVTSQIAFGFDQYYDCSIEVWGSQGRIYTNRIFTAPPGHKPVVQIEKDGKLEKIELESDHHFKKMLCYFISAINNSSVRSDEYDQNIRQARLIMELRKKANE